MSIDIEVLRKKLKELQARARSDPNLSDDQLAEILGLVRDFQSSLEAPSGAIPAASKLDVAEFERLRRKLTVIQAIETERNPSYFPEFAAALAEYPFALPTALFEPQGKEVVSIDLPNTSARSQSQDERLDLALSILYPGSFTYRYYAFTQGMPVKIETGQWSQSFVAHLRMHTLSPEPVFEVKKNGRTFKVHRPLVLRARQLNDHTPLICINCLSLSGVDEGCFHSQQLLRRARVSSTPRIEYVEVSRNEGQKKELREPLNKIIDSVTYLPLARMGEAVLGFERSSAAFKRVTRVDYDPPIGMELGTRGLSFKIRIGDEFIKHLLEQKMIVRDAIVQLLAVRLSDLMTGRGIPSYYIEPILSGLVDSLGLDENDTDLDSIMKTLPTSSWVENAVRTAVNQGAAYYEKFDLQEERLRGVYGDSSRIQLDWETVERELKTRLMHSLAHVLLIAGCVTSGSTFQDLEYAVKEDEVLIFDSADGGNGSSDMIFEFCSTEGTLDMRQEEEVVGKESTFKPKYMDDALADLLLPCQQGVSERVFHRGLPAPRDQEIQRRFQALENQRQSYEVEYSLMSEIGVENSFISSIGFHEALSRQLSDRVADRLHETLGICVHGCPDCLALGNKCNEGGLLERYHVSKVVLDEYFRFKMREISLEYSSSDDLIESVLAKNKAAILTMRVPRANQVSGDPLQDKVSELLGRKVEDKYIRFAGFWIDNPISSNDILYNAMLGLV